MDEQSARKLILDTIVASLTNRNFIDFEIISLKFYPTIIEISQIMDEIEYFESYLAFKLLMKSADPIEVFNGMNANLAEFITANKRTFDYANQQPDMTMSNIIAKALKQQI